MARLLIVSASTRSVSNGRPLARWVGELAGARTDFETTLVDLRELALPMLDEPELPATGNYAHQATKDWSAVVGSADAFLFVMPTYNGGFSAPLKNAIDSLYAEWKDKPVGLIGYSLGARGGQPAADMIRPVLTQLGMRPAEETYIVPKIGELLTTEGDFRPSEEVTASVTRALDAVAALLAETDSAAVAV